MDPPFRRCAVVGCGALGSYYGARLLEAGANVHFLLRSDYDAVRLSGVHIESYLGDLHVQPRCARSAADIGEVDLVLIGLKTTANDQFATLLPPLVGPRTLVVTLQNGLGNEARLAALFGPRNILGGLCFVCLNRLAPGRIHHSAHGHIVLGEYQRAAADRTQALAEFFRQARVPCEVTNDLECAHWEKLVWNVPFNGLGVAGAAGWPAFESGAVPSGIDRGACLPTDRLLSDPGWARLVRDLMLEIIRTAAAFGHAIPESCADLNIERTRVMGSYRASTLIDFERGQPIEIESLFLEPYRRACQAGVPVPRLAALVSVLRQLDWDSSLDSGLGSSTMETDIIN